MRLPAGPRPGRDAPAPVFRDRHGSPIARHGRRPCKPRPQPARAVDFADRPRRRGSSGPAGRV